MDRLKLGDRVKLLGTSIYGTVKEAGPYGDEPYQVLLNVEETFCSFVSEYGNCYRGRWVNETK